MSTGDCAAILLAAGASTRLGFPKQLFEWRGESLLKRAARLAAEAGCDPVICVVGFDAGRMRAALDGTAAVAIENPQWPSGMASSLVCGLRAVLESPTPAARVLVLVSDQVLLEVNVLHRLLDAHTRSGKAVAAAEYSGRAGVPAVFSARVFPELLALQGDRGARSAIAADPGRVEAVPWPDGAFDLDSMEDVKALRLPST